jgi:hypothetical protein
VARSHRRTVDSGRCRSAAIWRCPFPAALATSAVPTISVASARRGSRAPGRRTWDRPLMWAPQDVSSTPSLCERPWCLNPGREPSCSPALISLRRQGLPLPRAGPGGQAGDLTRFTPGPGRWLPATGVARRSTRMISEAVAGVRGGAPGSAVDPEYAVSCRLGLLRRSPAWTPLLLT